MGQTSDPETLVIHQKLTPGNNPKNFKQHYNHGGSLQLHRFTEVCQHVLFLKQTEQRKLPTNVNICTIFACMWSLERWLFIGARSFSIQLYTERDVFPLFFFHKSCSFRGCVLIEHPVRRTLCRMFVRSFDEYAASLYTEISTNIDIDNNIDIYIYIFFSILVEKKYIYIRTRL
jgi:hypothetical protein